MGDITTYNSVSIAAIMSRLDHYKYNPSGIQRVALETIDEITNGTINIVDPTNPFVFLLEASAINTALAVNESMINTRKLYPALNQTEEELYLHMSDKDYLNRFATPTDTEFTVVVQVNDIMNKMVADIAEGCTKAIIPRDTEFKIDNLVFTLQYPIVIRKFDNGVLQISYDTTIASPLEGLSSNIIDYTVRRSASLVDWIFFNVKVKQFQISTTYFPLQKGQIFSNRIQYTDQFYFIRAFYRNSESSDTWIEMLTTHTDQIFDSLKPTALIKVYSGEVEVSIPLIYFMNNLISGEVRFDIYTTKGSMTVNLANYKAGSFSVKFKAIDEERDLNNYTNAMLELSSYAYCDKIVSGGTNGISFSELRERVINNSIGLQNIPITPVQLDAVVSNNGFDLIKNVDVITNRVLLAAKKLPDPTNDKLITAANIGISTFISNSAYLKTLNNVADNGDSITLLSKNLYINNNGIIKILTTDEIDAIKMLPKTTMVNNINSAQYLYSPFYYVLDNGQSEFEVRAYNLDYPESSNLSFIAQNQSLQLAVNTGSYQLSKIDTGYRLTVATKSGSIYKQLPDGNVGIQLAFYPVGETNPSYINGTLAYKTEEGERVYTFDIVTNYNVNTDHQLCITNSKMFNNEQIDVWVDLSPTFHLLHYTTSITEGYVADATDSYLGKFLLPNNPVGNTHETLTMLFGTSLKNLWVRSRSLPTGLDYQTHEFDVPMVYEEDIYDKDPITGAIFTIDANGTLTYLVKYRKGDTVLDNDGNTVYKHRRGDVVLDTENKPIVISSLTVDKEIDILFIDGRYYFADDNAFKSYRDEIAGILDSWITDNLIDIQKVLLEKTKIYFYPKTTLGKVKVTTEAGNEDYVTAEQSFTVDLDVPESIYLDTAIRKSLEDDTVSIIDSYISEMVVNMTEISEALKAKYGNSVLSLSIIGLGNTKNYRIVKLASEHNRLCLKKILEIQQEGSLIIREDVTINFHLIK